ncbi:SCO family protein [Puniceicoccaceae bacterium K14]|nr:SCO family protein [Puniceicoccaceae bacterium K14]
MIVKRVVSLFWLLIILTSCSDPNTKEFQVSGVVVEVLEEQRKLVIDHEEIPDYMPRMVMPFKVKPGAWDETIAAGDVLSFEYKVQKTFSWIDNIKKTGTAELLEDLVSKASFGNGTELLSVGDLMDDYAFLGIDGETVRLTDLAGNRIAMTFIFSRCPVPEYCPRMMRNFSAVAGALEKSDSISDKWTLLTVSFDPEYDTPEVLDAYGDSFGQESDNWLMMTCEDSETLSKLAVDVGLKFGETNGTYLHNLRTVVLDEERRVLKIFTDENWDPEALVDLLVHDEQS